MTFLSPSGISGVGRWISGLFLFFFLMLPPSFSAGSGFSVFFNIHWVGVISFREIGKSLVLPDSMASSRPTIPSVNLLDLSGNPVPVESLVGHPFLLVSLMATWCRPCLREIPSLVSLSRKMGGRLAVAGVVEGKANLSVLDKIRRRYGKRYLLRLDPTMRFASGLHVHALPESFLVDSRGKIVSRVEGQVDWTNPQVVRYLESFLEKKAGT